MDIVDSQIHLGPGGIAEMVAALDALGIASALIDEYWMGTPGLPYHPAGENGQIRRATAPTAELACWQHPERFAYLVRPDPRDPELDALVRLAADNPHVRALRIVPGMSRADMRDFADGVFDRLMALAVTHDLPMFVQIAGHAALLEPAISRFPDLRVIICHCGMPPGDSLWPIIAQMEGMPDSEAYWSTLAGTPHDDAFDAVLKLARHPNIALKWAHAPGLFAAPGYPNLRTRPYLRRAIDNFGADRVMWASDISANQTGESWAELLHSVREDPGLTDDETRWVLGGTARRWLGWPLSANKP